MADTNDLILLEDVVTEFLLAYQKTTVDYTQYLTHAALLIRDFHIHDSNKFRTEKIAVDALGIIEMPDDMIKFGDLSVAYNGEWWSFTERRNMVNTTTTTLDVEGQDADFGEGVDLLDGPTTTYGSRGAINEYYYMLDWNARRIFCDGIISDTVVLKYVSSGISATEDLYVPSMLVLMIYSYLLWRETYWISTPIGRVEYLRKEFENERLRVRNVLNSMTASQWRDLFWGAITLGPKR